MAAALVLAAGCGDNGESGPADSTSAASDSSTTVTPSTSEVMNSSTTTPATPTTAEATPGTAETPTTATEAAYPVTITHALGETTIAAEPSRVVTLGTTETDAVLSLGIVPVGAAASPASATGIPVWSADALDPSTTTLVMSDQTGMFDPEEIAALKPDLIIATSASFDADSYAVMSQIAPTVPYLTTPFADSWIDVTTTVGLALGDPEGAQAAIDGATNAIDAFTDALTGLAGATYTFNVVPAPAMVISVTNPDDFATQFFGELGLSIAPAVADLPREVGTGAAISPEALDWLDADAVFMFYISEEAAASVRDNPVFQATTAAAQGRVIELDGEQATAVRSPTVAAIPWVLDQLEPQLVTHFS